MRWIKRRLPWIWLVCIPTAGCYKWEAAVVVALLPVLYWIYFAAREYRAGRLWRL